MGKIEEASSKLQKEADQNDMPPIWNYQRKPRKTKSANNIAIKKQDGTERQGMQETMKRWGEWEDECFRKDKARLKPKIEQIPDQEWDKVTMRVQESITEIRQRASITKIIDEEPEIETWLNLSYTEKDIDIEIRNIANREAHGNDGIPGAAYKSMRQWETKPITRITNQIHRGTEIPEDWEN